MCMYRDRDMDVQPAWSQTVRSGGGAQRKHMMRYSLLNPWRAPRWLARVDDTLRIVALACLAHHIACRIPAANLKCIVVNTEESGRRAACIRMTGEASGTHTLAFLQRAHAGRLMISVSVSSFCPSNWKLARSMLIELSECWDGSCFFRGSRSDTVSSLRSDGLLQCSGSSATSA